MQTNFWLITKEGCKPLTRMINEAREQAEQILKGE